MKRAERVGGADNHVSSFIPTTIAADGLPPDGVGWP
ncbi:hypothetical protein CCACVL1_22436 [Corchorus capsularis]|uniref:Uncharacterized protein n=1 Tax=Corchorus capsularis TaxID=210143 RepID=A0A1R3GYU9_COCAP|nr:hypothetical protein CCACVL1_22436 [Corchorus capsularis]